MHARLPRPDELIVERRKIVGYLLGTTHPDGVSKAKFFAALGFDANRWQDFAEVWVQHGREREVVWEAATPYDLKFVLRCEIASPDGRNPCIDSVWIAEDEAPPRLVTAYPHT